MIVIGIDPGKSGGLAYINTAKPRRDGSVAFKFAATATDIANDLRHIVQDADECFAYLERVGATPQMGVTSAFTFGRGYGFLHGCLASLGIPYEEVLPNRWQGSMPTRTFSRTIGLAAASLRTTA